MRILTHLNLLLALILALLVFTACTMSGSTLGLPATPVTAIETPEPGTLAVTNVHARPSPLEGGTGAVYLTVLNGFDQPLQLTSVAGDVAKSVEMHETVNDQGVMRMEPRPDGFTIPAGAALELKPGGKHIMLIDLAKPLATGDVFTLTLQFDNASALIIEVPVGMGEEPAVAPTPEPAKAELAPPVATLGGQQNGDLQVWLSSTPAQPVRGEATIDAYVVTSDGQPVTDAKVTFDVDMTNMSHGKYLAPAEPSGDGRYVGGVHFSMPGPWRIITIIERSGHETVKLRFEFMVNRR